MKREGFTFIYKSSSQKFLRIVGIGILIISALVVSVVFAFIPYDTIIEYQNLLLLAGPFYLGFMLTLFLTRVKLEEQEQSVPYAFLTSHLESANGIV
ncbi:MAG: hypothetical protein AAFY71_03095 [Bacteroidota bacterium]